MLFIVEPVLGPDDKRGPVACQRFRRHISARSNDADMVSEKLSWPSSKDLVGRGWVGCMKSVLSIGGNLSV